MSLSKGALTIFWWLVDLVACGVLISWITILTNHLRLVLAMKKQKLPLSSLPWHNSWTGKSFPSRTPAVKLIDVSEWSTPVALVLCIVILLTAGFPVFTTGNWSASRFVSSYLWVTSPKLYTKPANVKQRYRSCSSSIYTLEIFQKNQDRLPK